MFDCDVVDADDVDYCGGNGGYLCYCCYDDCDVDGDGEDDDADDGVDYVLLLSLNCSWSWSSSCGD